MSSFRTLTIKGLSEIVGSRVTWTKILKENNIEKLPKKKIGVVNVIHTELTDEEIKNVYYNLSRAKRK